MVSIEKPKLFYGYWILLAGFICLFVNSGIGFYSFGILFKPIQSQFGWSREVTSIAFTSKYFVQAAAAPFVGRLIGRYGAKNVITLGALITVASLFLLSFTQDLWYFYTGYAIMGVGLASIGQIPVSLVVSNWFVKRRGTAIGIVGIGIGAGGIVMSPIIGEILIPNFGWRATYQILAIISLVLVIATVQLIMKTTPQEIGLTPDGLDSSKPVEKKKLLRNRSEDNWTWKATVRTPTFWLIVVAFVLYSIGQVGTMQHLVNHLTDIQFSVLTATLAVSLTGFGSAVGKFFFGFLSDYLEAKYCTIISFLFVLVSVVMLLFLTPTSSPAFFWAFSLLMGLGVGGWVPLESILISSNFGMANYGSIYGFLTLFHNVATGVGPVFFGYIYDVNGSYYWAFIATIIMLAVGVVAILALRRPKLPQASSSASKN